MNGNNYKMRNILTIDDRKAVLQAYDSGQSIHSLAKKYNCCSKQLLRIVSGRVEIERQFARDRFNEQRMLQSKETQRQLKIDFLDSVLIEYVQRAVYHNKPLNVNLLQDIAHKVKEAIAVPNFKASYDWISQFLERHHLTILSSNELRAQLKFVEPKESALNHMELINYVRMRNKQKVTSKNNNKQGKEPMKTTIIVEVEDARISSACLNEELTIRNPAEAFKYLKALQEYAMLQENYRAIGLLTQTENALLNPPECSDFELE